MASGVNESRMQDIWQIALLNRDFSSKRDAKGTAKLQFDPIQQIRGLCGFRWSEAWQN
ncbi:hypothetical protein GCM10025794_02190 [Massilia kyonggiensis]